MGGLGKRKSEEPHDGSERVSPEPETSDRPPIRPYVRPTNPFNPPITDYKLVPQGWNPDDYDIPE